MLVGLNYKTAQIKLRDANLKIHVLAYRRDRPLEPGIIIAPTPQAGERVDCGTVIGLTMSGEEPGKKQSLRSPDSSISSQPPKSTIRSERTYRFYRETG